MKENIATKPAGESRFMAFGKREKSPTSIGSAWRTMAYVRFQGKYVLISDTYNVLMVMTLINNDCSWESNLYSQLAYD